MYKYLNRKLNFFIVWLGITIAALLYNIIEVTELKREFQDMQGKTGELENLLDSIFRDVP